MLYATRINVTVFGRPVIGAEAIEATYNVFLTGTVVSDVKAQPVIINFGSVGTEGATGRT